MAKRIGSMALGAQERSEERAEALIADYLDLLESQSQQPGLHAYRELAETLERLANSSTSCSRARSGW